MARIPSGQDLLEVAGKWRILHSSNGNKGIKTRSLKGYFRVWYDDDTWKPILAQLNSNPLVFDELTRAQFIADAIALQQ
ncbi:unnamed protein product [Anisakis simplex]|uniref:GUN4 domain-containing protein n=1 Tax=Anisakis simplex TaxID=6269 RepID=A0A0M3JER2_ANISI|nr:unnamed protein product [Anisakis simplex]